MNADEWKRVPPEVKAVLAKMVDLLSYIAESGMLEAADPAIRREVEVGMMEIYQELERDR